VAPAAAPAPAGPAPAPAPVPAPPAALEKRKAGPDGSDALVSAENSTQAVKRSRRAPRIF
jgi:hypothetical protein